MVTVWGPELDEAKALRNISGILSPGGDGADAFAWMLLDVQSVQHFVATQIHHQQCNPISQPRIPTKVENEVRVSIQVLWSLLPLRSMPTNHAFHYLNWHQTQPVSILPAPCPSLHILRNYSYGRSISFMSPFISLGGSPPWLGGLRNLAQFITFQICSSLISGRLALPLFVLPFAVWGLFSLMEKAEASGEELRVYLLSVTLAHHF